MSVLKEFNPATNQWETILIGKPGEPANLANTAPADLGVPAVGTAITAARGNHVHKMPSASDVGAAANNDPRLTDARTPTDGSVTDTKIVSGGLSPTAITGTAVVTGDARLSDERTPLDNSVTSAKIVNGTIVDEDINATAAIAPTKINGQAVVRTELSATAAQTLSASALAGTSTDVSRADHVHDIMYDVPAGAVSFDTTPTGISSTAGKVYWDTDFATLAVTMSGPGAVTVPVGQKAGAEVKNKSGVTITKGKVVQFSGASGGNIETEAAVNNGVVNPRLYFGVAAEEILDDAEGFVVTTGYIRGLNTNAWAVGTLLYIGASGDLTNTAPAKPAFQVPVAAVTMQNAAAGVIYVRMNNGLELNELFDVSATSPTAGDSLVYTTRWEKTRLPKIHYQTSTPSTGIAAGDIWVDSDGTA